MSFTVFAGNMYCGVLDIIDGTHIFWNRSNKCMHGTEVTKYKRLKLVRRN